MLFRAIVWAGLQFASGTIVEREPAPNTQLQTEDSRSPIMPPIKDGFPPPACEDPPSEGQILRAMPRVARGVPYLYEEFRDDIDIRVERLVDKIDPVRFYPLVGPAQLHHCHYKCIIYYTETVQSSYPFPVKVKKRRVEVIYIDKDHLHQYAGPDPVNQDKIAREHATDIEGELKRLWFNEQPSHLTPERVHGGIQ